ncbi:MAG: PGF-CTERM sorting domain-containing protein [Methanosarcinaceae archaeon]
MRTNLIILLTLMFVLAIPLVFVQEAQAITLDKTYSNFGFSFKYPKGMSLSENGMIDARANDDSGMIIGELEGHILEVCWMKMAGISPTNFMPEIVIENTFSGMETVEGTIIDRGKKGETTVNGHKIIYQQFDASIEDISFNGVVGLWYCNESEKQFILLPMSEELDAFSLFNDYLGSFVCNHDQDTQISTPLFTPKFSFSTISISPHNVEKGKAVTIKVDVTNDNEEKSSTIVNLKIKDKIVDSKEVILDAGETKSVKFIHIAEDEVGTYVVEIDNEVGSYEVTPGFYIVFAIAGLLAVAYILKRRE